MLLCAALVKRLEQGELFGVHGCGWLYESGCRVCARVCGVDHQEKEDAPGT